MFTYRTTVRLQDTDAAGILYFANQFTIIHEGYEEMFDEIGFGFARLIKKCDFFLPIVHAEADYKATLCVGDKLEIKITVLKIGQTSFILTYDLKRGRQRVGTAQTVHVSINKKTKKKILLPSSLRTALKRAG